MSFETYIVLVGVFVSGLVLGSTWNRARKRNDGEFLGCFMRDLKDGRYKRT